MIDKTDVLLECKRNLYDVETYIRLSLEEMESVIARIKSELTDVVGRYNSSTNGKCHCKNQIKLYIIWKILKNLIGGSPIVAGYNWILTPASIIVGHYFSKFSSNFDSILTDSLSLLKLFETSHFREDCFYLQSTFIVCKRTFWYKMLYNASYNDSWVEEYKKWNTQCLFYCGN